MNGGLSKKKWDIGFQQKPLPPPVDLMHQNVLFLT